MKKKELEKKLIEAENMVKTVREELDKLDNPKFEAGKWYVPKKHINPNSKLLINYQEGDRCYGFLSNGEWVNYHTILSPRNWREATKEEVREGLIAEAKRRGYKEGVKIHSITFPGDTYTLNHVCAGYQGSNFNCGGATIFKDGQWAEIIQELEINGHKVELHNNVVKIGCTHVSHLDISQMYSLVLRHDISSIIHEEAGEITIEQIKQLRDEIA